MPLRTSCANNAPRRSRGRVMARLLAGFAVARAARMKRMGVALAASFHGGRLASDAPDSPHLNADKIEALLYFGHSADDASMTPAMREESVDLPAPFSPNNATTSPSRTVTGQSHYPPTATSTAGSGSTSSTSISCAISTSACRETTTLSR